MAESTFPGTNPFGGGGFASTQRGSSGNIHDVAEEDENTADPISQVPAGNDAASPFSGSNNNFSFGQNASSGPQPPSAFRLGVNEGGGGGAGGGGQQGFPSNYSMARRTSVSAESLNPSAADDNWKPPYHAKSADQLERLKSSVSSNFLFSHLPEESSALVLGALVEKPIPAKDIKVITQGDAGDYFYVVEKGTFDIYINSTGTIEPGPNGMGNKVNSIGPGGSFGELALMYNAPRAATVISTEPNSTLWALDRVTFRRILMDSAFQRRRMYESFLEEVPLLSSLTPYERSKIADALETQKFSDGQTIIQEGDKGEAFFMVEAGEAEVFKKDVGDGKEAIKLYKKGDYFGELALLDDKPRAASVVSKGECKVATLGKDGFQRLLGPVEGIMRRNDYSQAGKEIGHQLISEPILRESLRSLVIVYLISTSYADDYLALRSVLKYYTFIQHHIPKLYISARCSAQLEVLSSSFRSSPASTAAIAANPSLQAARRSSVITNQLYQFALGYPQTPSEDSPVSEPIEQSTRGEQEDMTGGMGSFVFRWDHPANDVYVTGTFDDWAKSVKLDKEDGGFAKRVELPLGETIFYKFVVDGNWTTDHTAPQKDDGAHNVNNVLDPDRISKSQASSQDPSTVTMSGVSADSTTAKLAGEVPKESSRKPDNADSPSSDLPGTFPETPANEASESSKQLDKGDSESANLPGTFPGTPANEASGFSVNPLPATSGFGNPINLQPGEKVPDPSTIASNTVSSTVKDDPSLSKPDESEKTFDVKPLPATGGIGNPIHLEPGEKVPDTSTFTTNTIKSRVTTDRESYEKGSDAPRLPEVVTPQQERDSKGASMFSVPEILKNIIPESSLPMGNTMPSGKEEKDPGAIIQSAGADTTTAALAGQVPKEPTGVPQIVQESQSEAGVDAEAGHNREALREKSDVEKELESKISQAPPTSEGIGGQTAGTGSVAGASGALSHGLPVSIQRSIEEINKGSAIAPTVPDVVQESIAESHVSPEAAGDKAMVSEKSAMEDELLKKIPTENAHGQPAPTSSAASGSAIAHTVPDVVQESIADAHVSPEAAGDKAMVSEKSAMEDELLKKIPTESAHGQPAPTASAASGSAIAPTVPDVVQESIAEAHVSPEAAADGTMVGEKRAMEDELLKKVPTENAAGQPGPVASAALSESAPAPTNPQSVTPHATTTQARGTAITTDSVADAATPNDQNIAPISTSANAPAASEEPSSATTPTASKGAKSFPTKSSAPPPTVVEPSTTSNTNMTTAAAPASTPATEQTARQSSDYSREVSPMTMTGHQTTPTVTTGVGSSSTAQQSTPPQAASSPTSGTSASTDKKSKRASGFFGKLKAKFSDKDKDKK